MDKPLNVAVTGFTEWTPTDFEIVTTQGALPVSGAVLLHFGIHQDDAGPWHLTHLPTGARFGHADSRERVEEIARAIRDLGDWSFCTIDGFPKGGTRHLIWETLRTMGLIVPTEAPSWNQVARDAQRSLGNVESVEG